MDGVKKVHDVKDKVANRKDIVFQHSYIADVVMYLVVKTLGAHNLPWYSRLVLSSNMPTHHLPNS